ncbi:MAG: biotin transporter BioY [Ruminococcaceae bacterium]|nr:biotin transporter BioY [Oscillospiraceae bacterium]
MKINSAKITRIALCTAFITVGAVIAFPTKPAFTLQTLCIFLSSLILKPTEAFLSTLIYILLGIIGVPVFAGFQGGISVITSVSGGFILSFPLIALMCSHALRRFRSSAFVYACVFTLATMVSYILGAAWIGIFSHAKMTFIDFAAFAIFDILKIAAATFCSLKLKKAFKNDKKKDTNNKS